jgi:DNA-directed RNA polymerase subunit RPC12/RpoP
MSLGRPSFQQQQFDAILQAGIAVLKGGGRLQAARLLQKAAQLNTTDARPWVWLSATSDDPNEQRAYLERAIALDPGNTAARRGLVMLSDKLDKTHLVPQGEVVAPRKPLEPERSQGSIYTCASCGGQLIFDVVKTDLVCEYCGTIHPTEKKRVAGEVEQSIDFVMPTTRAHRWAEAQQQVSCAQCGAISLLPPAQKADRCPYCGSQRFLTAAGAVELIDPHAIALMKIDAKITGQKVKEWFRQGAFTPDDLANRSRNLQMRPAYYPFWAFDGTLEVAWHCEVNEGSNRAPHWVMRSGNSAKMFDDVLVPGIKAISVGDLKLIEPYDLQDLFAFSPDFLIGWTALAYDLPLADASLQARERVVKLLRNSLEAEIVPGRQKRNVTLGAGNWSGLMYKLILLPLWMGHYEYRGRKYGLFVNGQNGKVGGQKPRDTVKAGLIIVAVILTILVLVIVVYIVFSSLSPAIR